MKCPKCDHVWTPEKRRSNNQNAYWWGVIVPAIAEASGFTLEEAHEALKAKFLGREDIRTGLLKIGSTASLDTKAFALLVDQVRLWSQEFFGHYIPAPNESDLAA